MLKKHLTRWSGGTFFGVMESFGLGDAFVSWIRMANLNPTASIVTNQSRSHRFPLERGTCQGCPLSPLLFTLAIEPLAISIRENKLIKPITIDGINHKISLYADDIASFLTDPEQSVPYLLDLISFWVWHSFGIHNKLAKKWPSVAHSWFRSCIHDLNSV